MESSTAITSISAEFSVGSATSKTLISMATSSNGISISTSSITHNSGRRRSSSVGVQPAGKKPMFKVASLRPADPVAPAVTSFIREVLQEYTAESFKLYSYSLTHPATIAYTVLLGGLLFQYGISKAFAFAFPPVLAFYVVKARLRSLAMQDKLHRSSDLNQASRYYNERKRALFMAVGVDTSSCSCDNNNLSEDTTDSTTTSTNATTGNILGTIAVDTECAGSTAVIRHLCVDPQYRRHGIGQDLLDQALAFCTKERFSRIILTTSNLQGPASKLCLKNGFRKVTETTDLAILPGVDISRNHFVRCLRSRHTSSCCR